MKFWYIEHYSAGIGDDFDATIRIQIFNKVDAIHLVLGLHQ